MDGVQTLRTTFVAAAHPPVPTRAEEAESAREERQQDGRCRTDRHRDCDRAPPEKPNAPALWLRRLVQEREPFKVGMA